LLKNQSGIAFALFVIAMRRSKANIERDVQPVDRPPIALGTDPLCFHYLEQRQGIKDISNQNLAVVSVKQFSV